MDREKEKLYESILRKEKIMALGCTEPIAIAYCGSILRKYLSGSPDKIELFLSGNMIKNVKSVKVPNACGNKGVECAMLLGFCGGDASAKLEVLENITDEDRKKAEKMMESGICSYHLKEDVPNLYIEAVGYAEDEVVEVVIEDTHTNIARIVRNGNVIYENNEERLEESRDFSALNLDDIIDFAENSDLSGLKDLTDREIECNLKIANEGITNDYGCSVGKTFLENNMDSTNTKCIAYAAAGSDARMSGCVLPVVIVSGSGNQGITASVPLIIYAKEKNIDEDKLQRALVMSNLIALYQKSFIGSLSAYCGVICSAAGVAAGITYFEGGDAKKIKEAVVNTIATIDGMVCDGANESCAAKIASALNTAFLGHQMAMNDRSYKGGTGLVNDDPEDTVKAIGHMAKEGMKSTDVMILNLMTGKKP